MDDLAKSPGDEDEQSESTALASLPQIAAAKSPSFIRDTILLFVLPTIVLVVTFIITDPTTFEYKIIEPTLWGIYTSNISHRSWAHLGSNLVGLFLIGGLEYLILTAVDYRKHYVAVFLGSLLVFPIFSHFFLQFVLINQPIFHSYEAVGFSEPLSALTAFLPIALTTYQNDVGKLRWPIFWALLLNAGGISWALFQIFGLSLYSVAIGMLGVASVVWFGIHTYRTNALRNQKNRIQYALTSLFVLSVYAFALQGLFGGMNVGSKVGHLSGFLPGFFVPMIVLWGISLALPEHELAIDLE